MADSYNDGMWTPDQYGDDGQWLGWEDSTSAVAEPTTEAAAAQETSTEQQQQQETTTSDELEESTSSGQEPATTSEVVESSTSEEQQPTTTSSSSSSSISFASKDTTEQQQLTSTMTTTISHQPTAASSSSQSYMRAASSTASSAATTASSAAELSASSGAGETSAFSIDYLIPVFVLGPLVLLVILLACTYGRLWGRSRSGFAWYGFSRARGGNDDDDDYWDESGVWQGGDEVIGAGREGYYSTNARGRGAGGAGTMDDEKALLSRGDSVRTNASSGVIHALLRAMSNGGGARSRQQQRDLPAVPYQSLDEPFAIPDDPRWQMAGASRAHQHERGWAWGRNPGGAGAGGLTRSDSTLGSFRRWGSRKFSAPSRRPHIRPDDDDDEKLGFRVISEEDEELVDDGASEFVRAGRVNNDETANRYMRGETSMPEHQQQGSWTERAWGAIDRSLSVYSGGHSSKARKLRVNTGDMDEMGRRQRLPGSHEYAAAPAPAPRSPLPPLPANVQMPIAPEHASFIQTSPTKSTRAARGPLPTPPVASNPFSGGNSRAVLPPNTAAFDDVHYRDNDDDEGSEEGGMLPYMRDGSRSSSPTKQPLLTELPPRVSPTRPSSFARQQQHLAPARVGSPLPEYKPPPSMSAAQGMPASDSVYSVNGLQALLFGDDDDDQGAPPPPRAPSSSEGGSSHGESSKPRTLKKKQKHDKPPPRSSSRPELAPAQATSTPPAARPIAAAPAPRAQPLSRAPTSMQRTRRRDAPTDRAEAAAKTKRRASLPAPRKSGGGATADDDDGFEVSFGDAPTLRPLAPSRVQYAVSEYERRQAAEQREREEQLAARPSSRRSMRSNPGDTPVKRPEQEGEQEESAHRVEPLTWRTTTTPAARAASRRTMMGHAKTSSEPFASVSAATMANTGALRRSGTVMSKATVVSSDGEDEDDDEARRDTHRLSMLLLQRGKTMSGGPAWYDQRSAPVVVGSTASPPLRTAPRSHVGNVGLEAMLRNSAQR